MAQSNRPVRVRTAANDRRKALEHYQELRRSGNSVRAVVISEDKDGAITVLGQMLKPDEIVGLLLVAADALALVKNEQQKPKFEPHHEPERRGIHNQSKPRPREVTTDADGLMVTPAGENLISCGECNHPRWYVFHDNATDALARYACAHCGNEVKSIPIFHQEGTA